MAAIPNKAIPMLRNGNPIIAFTTLSILNVIEKANANNVLPRIIARNIFT